MTAPGGREVRLVLGAAAAIGIAVAAHAAIVSGAATVGALVALVPLAILFSILVRRMPGRGAALALLAVALAVLLSQWGRLERHFPDVIFVEHVLSNLALAILFGRTLRAGREPLVTRFARIMHGEIPERVQRYTRRVTLAWTVFFTLLMVVSCALFLSGFLAAWSFLANIASPFLIAGMFAVEYAVRLRALPNWPQVGILGGAKAFMRHMHAAREARP